MNHGTGHERSENPAIQECGSVGASVTPSTDNAWSRPGELSDGAQVPIAIYVPVTTDGMRGTEWVMDSSFLFDEQDLDLPWPWAQGFVPNARDWDAIGIPALS